MLLNDLIGGHARIVQAGPGALSITGLALDSRAVAAGNLFAALPGAKVDGLSFVPGAVAAGAVAILVGAGQRPAVPAHVALIEADHPRLALAKFAARFYGRQPKNIVAVTGTSGKTSTTVFARQLWSLLGHRAASLGTIGLIGPDVHYPESLTTPDPLKLHQLLAELAEKDIDHLAMEASSHGLDQFRLDGVEVSAAAFTNLTRDHLDYHLTMDAYLTAKLRLFAELLPAGGAAVVNADIAESEKILSVAKARHHRVITFGRKSGDLRILNQQPLATGQQLSLSVFGERYDVTFSVAGLFQAENLLAALGLVIGEGEEPRMVLRMVDRLTGVHGRIERVATTPSGAAVYVDYAHKPAGLDAVLSTLRPHTTGRLVVVFGCGGDRDKGKRPEMGELAMRLADRVIVTDDNPRSEDPAQIRREILAAAPGAIEIGDRAAAIRAAMQDLKNGDLLVIAGKGHETYQIVGDKKFDFDDSEVARQCAAELAKGGRMSEILWTASEVAAAVKGKALADFAATGVSIDTRKIAKGDLFVALQGPNFDGHNYIAAALKAGATGVIAHRLPDDVAKGAPVVLVADTLQALQDLGAAARNRSEAKFIAVTGSVGKTSTKEALRTVLSAQLRAFASEGNLNNHWGAPLSLARMPRGTEIGIFELGMNHADEIRPLAKMVRPHVAIITTVEAVHIEFFDSVEGIADAKAEILEGLEPGGVAVLPRDNTHFARMAQRAAALGVGQVISFGSDAASDVRLLACETLPDGNRAQADVMGQRVDFETGLTGHHQAINALAVLATVKAVGAHIARAAKDMAGVKPLKGRGYREEIQIAGGSFMLMDESYNASPAAMRAAFAVLAGLPIVAGGRRIAILGDMRELGKEGPALHRGLKDDLVAAGIDAAYLIGPLMAELFALLPEKIRGEHTPDSMAMAAIAPKAIRANDIVLVKGSLGTRMAPIVEAIRDMDINAGQRPKAANGNSRG